MSQAVKKAKKKKRLEGDLVKHSINEHKVETRRTKTGEIATIPSKEVRITEKSFNAKDESITPILCVKAPPIRRLAQAQVSKKVVGFLSRRPELSSISKVKKRFYVLEIRPTQPEVVRVKRSRGSDSASKLCRIRLSEPSIKSINLPQRKPPASSSIKPLKHVKPTPFIITFEIRRITIQPKETRPRVEKGERATVVVEELIQRAATASQPAAEGLEEELEIPDFMRLLFGEAMEFIAQDKPICILVRKDPEEFHKAIATICRDVFRERVGGKPTPIWEDNLEKLLEEWRPIVEGKVIVIENLGIDDKNLRRKLEKMLKCFFSQDYGFLIIVTEDPKKLKYQLQISLPSVSSQIVIADCSRLARFKHQKPHIVGRLLKAISGNKLRIENMEIVPLGESIKAAVENFDDHLIKEYLDPIKALKSYPRLAEQWHKVLASRSDRGDEAVEGELASKIHSALKALIWIYEWQRNKERVTIVLEGEKECDVHVSVDSGYERYYEIETLFGVGDILKKLVEKMEKYKSYRDRKDVEIVFAFRNIDILRHLQLLYHFRRFWRKRGYQVKIVGFDLSKGEPLASEDFLKLANSLSSYLSS